MWSINPPKITPPCPSEIPPLPQPLSVQFLPQTVLKPFQPLKSVPQPSIFQKVLKKNAVGGRYAVKRGIESSVFVAEEGASSTASENVESRKDAVFAEKGGSGNDAVFAEKGGSGNDAVFAEKWGSGNDAVLTEKGGSVNAAVVIGKEKSGNDAVVDNKAKEFSIIDVNVIDFDYRCDVSVPGVSVARGRVATSLVMVPVMFWVAAASIHVVQATFAKAILKFINKMLGAEGDETKPKTTKPNNEG